MQTKHCEECQISEALATLIKFNRQYFCEYCFADAQENERESNYDYHGDWNRTFKEKSKIGDNK